MKTTGDRKAGLFQPRIGTPWPVIAQSRETPMELHHGVPLCLDSEQLYAGSRTDRQQPLAVST
jgi:hypothetical protein